MKRISILFTTLLLLCACSQPDARYSMNLQADQSVVVTAPDQTEVIYQPVFMVMRTDANPNKMLRRGNFGVTLDENHPSPLLYNVPTWGKADDFKVDPSLHIEDGFNPVFDRSYGKDRTANYFMAAPIVKMEAEHSEQTKDGIVWYFPENEDFTLTATLDLSQSMNGLPRLTLRFQPKSDAWYSIGYVGAPESDIEQTDEIWQAQIWAEKRFPNLPFLTESFNLPIPGTLKTVDGVTQGLMADPSYVPFEAKTPKSDNSQFGALIRNQKGLAQSVIFAPVLGNADSQMKAGETFEFKLYLYHEKSPLLSSYQHLSYDFCSFSDFRRNSTCNLNTTIDNMVDFFQSPYARFVDTLRGCNYSTDVPGAVKNISSLLPFETAILTDDAHIFHRMARPMMEYGLSRERFLFSPDNTVKGQNTSSRLKGPGIPLTELTTAYTLSGNTVDYMLQDAQKMYDNKTVRNLNLDSITYEDRWINSLALYRATGDKKYLDQAIKDCDQYLAERVDRTQTDFDDKYSIGRFFWTSYTNQWMELLQMYQITGIKRYLDAAEEGAMYYAQLCWMLPVVPEGTLLVNKGGMVPKYRFDNHFQFMHLPEAEVDAWKLSEIGLTPESSGTCSGHRAIFMANHAPFMMRIAAETGNQFLHDIARNAIVGRYECFPGYHINAGRTNAFERKDFAYRSQNELNGHTSIHYNHIPSFLAVLWDYLFSDFYFVSDREISFPSQYAEGYAYCRSLIYGSEPGHFYNEQNVIPYMPQGIVSVSDIQANYLTARGNGKFYLALANQSEEEIEVTVHFDEKLTTIQPGINYSCKVWKQNKPAGKGRVENGEITLHVAAKGITAIAIDGVDIKPSFQNRLGSDSAQKWEVNHTSVGMEKDRAVLFDFGPGLKSIYVWMEADNSIFKEVTLHYVLDDGKEQVLRKTTYPYEYTIPLEDQTEEFTYWFESITPEGKRIVSSRGTLNK